MRGNGASALAAAELSRSHFPMQQTDPARPVEPAALVDLGLARSAVEALPGLVAAWYAGEVGHPTTEGSFMSLTLEQFGIDRLSPQERCELIDLLWDSLPPDAPFIPPEWHLRELERRVAAADADPGAAEPWEAVRARLSRKP